MKNLFAKIAQSGNIDSLPVYLHNTLGNTLEQFTPRTQREVRMYTCGPTVYNYAHIGNLRSFVFADTLRRTLEYNGWPVKQVVNITDVGHLTGENEGDADTGEDKMTAALRREGKKITKQSMKRLGERYTRAFCKDIAALNVREPAILSKASEHIDEQIALIKTLEEKGYAYTAADGVYFDTTAFPEYGVLGGSTQQDAYARVAHTTDKRQPQDFALWKYSDELGWKSPWGNGFPGWHIECSAMAMRYLGKQFDIHTGGMDHIAIHHNNEIAQSEAATGKRFARYWLHNAFVTVEDRKISKSIGNTIYLYHITERGFTPLSYRYWLLTAHYRSPVNFTWGALAGAHRALYRLHREIVDNTDNSGTIHTGYEARFHRHINNDLDTPNAIAVLWEMVKDQDVSAADTRATLLACDAALGIGLQEAGEQQQNLINDAQRRINVSETPDHVQQLIEARERARAEHAFERADELRDQIEAAGYQIQDTDEGPQLRENAVQ